MPKSLLTRHGACHDSAITPGHVPNHLLRRQRLAAQLRQRARGQLPPALIKQHVEAMPPHYWERVTKTELLWALEILQRLTTKSAAAEASRSVVVADSRYYPERGVTKVMIAAWDRPGLLAKVAAAFSVLRVNIVRADVYTRADGIALDLFEVEETSYGWMTETQRLEHLVFLLEGALSEPPRFISVWASEFHKAVPRTQGGPVRIEFDNDCAETQTVIRVEAPDRLGLLHDLLRVFPQCGLNVVEAQVETEEGRARDVFYVTDLKRGQVADPIRLENIRRALLRAIGCVEAL